MLIKGQRFRKVDGATLVPGCCKRCNNQVHRELYSTKVGPGLSIPGTGLFTDRFTLAYKMFYLICPICQDAQKLSRSEAKGLGA